MEAGKVYLVGAGPGDPGLITWKGLRLLKTCDVVIYDRLASGGLLRYIKDGCEKIYVGKASGSHSMKQEEINRILVEKAGTSKSVVRLKGGDPYVFGRGGEEALALKEHGISYEVIPGISSAIASLAYAGIPITHRGTSQSFHVITGHTAQEEDHLPQDMRRIAGLEGTIVVLMGLGNLDRIRNELLAGGKPADTPAAIISKGTTPRQTVVRGTLEDICGKAERADIRSPAIIVIGKAAEYDLRSGVSGVLSGIKVGITGTRSMLDKLSEHLEELGAGVEIMSSSRITEFKDNGAFHRLLENVEQYTWLVFTSANAVDITFHRMKALKIDYRRLARIKFAVIGRGTEQELLRYGFQADFKPSRASVTALAEELGVLAEAGERILIPRAALGSEELIKILGQKNKDFDDVKIYDIIDCDMEESSSWKAGSFDYLTFASSSGVHGFMKIYGDNPSFLSEGTRIVCIGEATAFTLKEYGFENVLMAEEASVQGMVGLIAQDLYAAGAADGDR